MIILRWMQRWIRRHFNEKTLESNSWVFPKLKPETLRWPSSCFLPIRLRQFASASASAVGVGFRNRPPNFFSTGFREFLLLSDRDAMAMAMAVQVVVWLSQFLHFKLVFSWPSVPDHLESVTSRTTTTATTATTDSLTIRCRCSFKWPEIRSKADEMGTFSAGSRSWTLAIAFLVLISSSSWSPAEAKRQQLEEIGKRQLDALIKSEDYLAVFWRKSFR